MRDTGYGPVAIKLRSTGEIIGSGGFYQTEVPDEAEIFYGFARHAWGQGYATEAGRTLITAGMHQLRLATIVAPIHPDNVRSIRVVEKLGMTFSHVTTTYTLYEVAHLYQLKRPSATVQPMTL